MRKVKVLAFVLAALMVVAAFAGCGTKDIKADVTTLDERVTALEALLKQVNDTVNGGATKDDITEILDAITANKAEAAAGDKTLADAIAKITADQATANAALKADLEKLVDAAKKDQAAGDTALQVAIEKLNNSLAATNKALEDSVKDLLEEIKDGDDANTKALADAINAINKAQADQTAASNKALEDAIKALQDSIKAGDDKNSEALLAAIEALNKKQDEQNAAIADALAGLKETIEKNKEEAGVNASVQAKAAAYVTNLTAAQTSYDLDEVHYTASDFAAIEKAIADGIVAIQAATTVEAVDAAYNAVVSELAKYERVDVALYNAYKALMNKINTGSKDAIKAYATQLSAAKEHYDDETPITAYVYAAGKTVNLVTEANEFTKAFNYLNQVVMTKISQAKSAVNAISRVQYFTLGKKENSVSNTTSTILNANTSKVTQAKDKYDIAVAEVTDNDNYVYAKYLDDALLNQIDVAKLEKYMDDVNALARAYALLPMYASLDHATGEGYDNVFGEYKNVAAGKKDWFNTEEYYAAINERIDAWRADNPVVDDRNAEAMLNKHATGDATSTTNFYKTYRANEKNMMLFVEWYDVFVDTLVPRIKDAQMFTEISTENVQTYIDIRKDIEAWTVVIPDKNNDKKPDLEVKSYDVANTQYMLMVQTAFKDPTRTTTFVFEEKIKVAPFFADTVAKAEAVADYINEQIEILAADTTSVSAEACKRLEGFVPSDGVYSIPNYTGTNKVDPEDLFDVNGNVVATANIAKFKSAFVKSVINGTDVYSYDLTYLLDLDVLEETEADIAARVAELKAKVTTITNKRTEIMKAIATDYKLKAYSDSDSNYNSQALRDAHIAKVNLNQKALVDELDALYSDLIAEGFKQNATREWAQYKVDGTVQQGKYTNNVILSLERIHEITDLVKNVKTLNDFQTNLAKFFKLINSANTFAAFNVEEVDTALAYTAKTSYDVWNVTANGYDTYYKWSYIANANKLNDTKTGFTYKDPYSMNSGSTDATVQPAITDGLTQLKAIEDAWIAYAQFTANNGGKTYADLEKAITDNNMDDFRLIAIKNKAWEIVAAKTTAPTTWNANGGDYGDYATYLEYVKNAIKNAPSVENLADILEGFCGLTKYNLGGTIDFAGVTIFHADGTLHYVVEDGCPVCGK